VVRLGQSEETIQLASRAETPYRFDEYAYAAVVADGIGGEGAGAVAARLAVSTLAQLELRFGQWNMRIDRQVAADTRDRFR
jgi:serine/threonine protein phosphatase PrpC